MFSSREMTRLCKCMDSKSSYGTLVYICDKITLIYNYELKTSVKCLITEQKSCGDDTPFTNSFAVISIGYFLLKVTVIITALCMNRPGWFPSSK